MGSGVRRRRHHDSSGWAFISHTPESNFPLSSNRCVFHNFALTPVGRSERVESALRLQHCQAQSSDPRLARLCCCQASLLIDGSPFGCPAGRSAGRLGARPPGHLAAQLPGRPAARQCWLGHKSGYRARRSHCPSWQHLYPVAALVDQTCKFLFNRFEICKWAGI